MKPEPYDPNLLVHVNLRYAVINIDRALRVALGLIP